MWTMAGKLKLARRAAMTAVTVWKALPAERKKQTLQLVRKHGPKLVKQAAKARAGRKKT
jgi:hypothetical protein